MILCVCSGLQYAHERGVLHRDIKPGNLMFSTGDVLKLTDFGIAKVLGGSAAVRTRTGRILGTPDYMAPEQAQGRELTPATDVYGCATVLYEMLSGTLPFDVQASPLAMMHARVTEDPKPLAAVAPGVPPLLARTIDRAIARDATARYRTAEQFGAAVARSATDAWGAGWLERSGVVVHVGGVILTSLRQEAGRPDGFTVRLAESATGRHPPDLAE